MKEENRNWHELIAKYQTGQLSDEEFTALEEELRQSKEARKLFHRSARIDSALRREAETNESSNTMKPNVVSFRRKPFMGGLGAAAALVILSALTFVIASQKRIVGTLVSTEGAAWETSLPTVDGSSLTRGSLRLTEGIATIQLDSGVELTIEAPSRLYVKGPQRVSVVSGTVIGKASVSKEFLLETEFGQAAFTGGEFVATLGKKGQVDRFEVFAGGLVVSHDSTRSAVKLEAGEVAILSSDGIDSAGIEEETLPVERFERGLRISSEARSATFIRNNNPYKWTRPEMLTMKKSRSGHGFDQRSVVAFDLHEVSPASVDNAVLRLNFVSSGQGLVSRLPETIRFSVYALLNEEKRNWSSSDSWEKAPAPSDGRLVGEFTMSRGQLTGAVEVSGEDMVEFVRANAGGSASFIVVCNTYSEEGAGVSYTHAIASASHPEAVGPTLEIFLQKTTEKSE